MVSHRNGDYLLKPRVLSGTRLEIQSGHVVIFFVVNPSISFCIPGMFTIVEKPDHLLTEKLVYLLIEKLYHPSCFQSGWAAKA